MSNFDDIFEGNASRKGQTNQPFDKEAWAEKKQAERQAVYDLADTTAEAVSANGSKFQAYLDVQTRFSRYSATNVLLILAQKPDATQLKDFDGWKDAGASIKRQQKGISILEPGEEYEREDGSIGTSYNVKRVFDISQTTARVKVQPSVSMDDRLLLKALISRPTVPMQMVDDLPNHMGALYDHDQQVIFVRRGMNAADIFRSVSKELAHAEIAAVTKDYTREGAAFAAYSVSYILCREYGVDASGYAVPETATYLEIRLTGDDAAKRATDAIRKIRSGESFDSVAASFSEEGKASEQTVKKENVTANGLQKLFTMKIGDVTDPIDNGDGSQSILKLKSKTEAGFQPVSEVSKEIRDTLLAEKTAKEYEQRKTETLFSIHSRRYTLGEFYTEFLELSETYQKEYVSFEKKKQLVEQIIAQELLLEESGDAASNGESAHDMEELKIQYLSQMIHQEEVDDKLAETTDEEARQYYEDNLDIMVLPSTIKLNLIWISQGENDEKKNQAKSKAEEALTALKDGTEFSTVAKQYSEDSSAENGGEIKSSFHEGELDPGLSKAISGLSAGEFSEIVDFAGGYYILQVRERTEARQLTFEEVSENIKAHLQEQQHEQLEADMEQTLLDRFGFTVYNKTLRQLMKEIASESTN